MGWKLKVLGGLASGSIGYYVGSAFGKALHNFLAYLVPLRYYGNYSWFNYQQYVQTYQQYSNNLDKTFSLIFGLVGAGVSLALYTDLLYSLEKGGMWNGR